MSRDIGQMLRVVIELNTAANLFALNPAYNNPTLDFSPIRIILIVNLVFLIISKNKERSEWNPVSKYSSNSAIAHIQIVIGSRLQSPTVKSAVNMLIKFDHLQYELL